MSIRLELVVALKYIIIRVFFYFNSLAMKRLFWTLLSVVCISACDNITTDDELRLLNEDNYGEVIISSSDLDGTWKMTRERVSVENGILKPMGVDNSLPYFGDCIVYQEFDRGDLDAGYSHYRFYGLQPDDVYCEYVIDKDVSSAVFTFDKKSRKGVHVGLDNHDGNLLLLKSDSSQVSLLLQAENDYYEVITLTKEDDQQVIDKLKSWEMRDINQMWEDCRKYWEENGK